MPKKKPGAFRVIQDLSYPKERAINDFIQNDINVVEYEHFDRVIDSLSWHGGSGL